MKPAIEVVRTPKGRYTLVLNRSLLTSGELGNSLAHACAAWHILEENWGNGLGPIEIGTANFITE